MSFKSGLRIHQTQNSPLIGHLQVGSPAPSLNPASSDSFPATLPRDSPADLPPPGRAFYSIELIVSTGFY
ncbi:unnamed protein product [Boreogadus saida]